MKNLSKPPSPSDNATKGILDYMIGHKRKIEYIKGRDSGYRIPHFEIAVEMDKFTIYSFEF